LANDALTTEAYALWLVGCIFSLDKKIGSFQFCWFSECKYDCIFAFWYILCKKSL